MRENKFALKVSRSLRDQNALVYPLIASERAPLGWPDKVVWHKYWQGFMELKSDTTVLKPHQIMILESLNSKRPLSAVVVRRNGADTNITVSHYVKGLTVESRDVALNNLLAELREWRRRLEHDELPEVRSGGDGGTSA